MQAGDFVSLRGRKSLVEATGDDQGFGAVRQSCVSDDAQGEQLEILWNTAISPEVLVEDGWTVVGRGAPHDQMRTRRTLSSRWTIRLGRPARAGRTPRNPPPLAQGDQ
jgi:hypothetical protein